MPQHVYDWFGDVFLQFHAVAVMKDERKNSIELYVYIENIS